jgi:hypothetical protein
MACVDLNPIRASLCNTPEALDLTNIIEIIETGSNLKKTTGVEIN